MNRRRTIQLVMIGCVAAVLLLGVVLAMKFGSFSGGVAPGTVMVHAVSIYSDKTSLRCRWRILDLVR